MSKHVDKWIFSDPHFCHNRMWGEEAWRPFKTQQDHDGTILENIMSVGKQGDKLTCLGDFAFGTDLEYIENILKTMSSKFVLDFFAEGNHDTENRLNLYRKYWKHVHSIRTAGHDLIFTHIPVHENQLYRWKLSVHGHMHKNIVMKNEFSHAEWDTKNLVHTPVYNQVPDLRYMNVSMEQINYTPASMDLVWQRYRELADK